jgi:iron only hydrogenase large subunit-like protein
MNDFHHALKIVDDLCIGCSLCMNICPTQAIRVRKGKAKLMNNRCIDCGECFRICPVGAILIEQDDFGLIFNYKYRVALIPAVFFGQFPSKYPISKIYQTLLNLGFTHVFEVENGVDIIKKTTREILSQYHDTKPLISTFCPAIVRLIQVKFPALVHNFTLLKPPLDIAALYFRKHLQKLGADESEIGIFYFTQCAAKIAAIKSPAEEEKSPITGVINMDSAFNKVYQKVKQENGESSVQMPVTAGFASNDVLWSLTTGESDTAMGRRMAIDGIHNVIAFLEKLEQEENPDFDFLELRACDESCAGGVLTSENRFLTVERIKKRVRKMNAEQPQTEQNQDILNYEDELRRMIFVEEIKPRSMMKLDEDMGEAMKKMKLIRQIVQMLPMVDCGACGSPGCYALAEDIVQSRGIMENCIFIQRRYEEKGMLKPSDSLKIMKNVWGSDKFELKKNQNNEADESK